MTCSLARSLVLALPLAACSMSHEVVETAPAVDAGATDLACPTAAGDPEWEPVAGDACGLAVARHPERLLSLCWGPCEDVTPAAACRAAPLDDWEGSAGAEHGDVAYFWLERFARHPPYAFEDLVVGSDGSARAAFARTDCLWSGAAFAGDAWGFPLETRTAERDAGPDTVDVHFGAIDDPSTWSPSRAVGRSALIHGVVTPDRLAVTGFQQAIFDADGGVTTLAPLHGGDVMETMAAIVADRVVWLERDATHTFAVQRRADGAVEPLVDDPTGDVLALGVDGPAYVWALGAGGHLSLYSATIATDPSALRPRRVNEGVAPDWTARPLGEVRFTFDHGHALIDAAATATTPPRIVVVDLGSGLAWALDLAREITVFAAVIESAHRATLAVSVDHAPSPPEWQLLAIDLDALTPLFHAAP